MKKTQKYLLFQDLKLELIQAHPKDVSRALFCLKDQQNGQTYKTQKYGQVQPQSIEWPEQSLQILYADQEMMRFETICQHQYGYQIQELEALYSGQIYIKTQNFFREMKVHVFDAQGHKCGILRYMIKIIERQVAKTAKKSVEIKQQPTVKVQLIGKVTLFAASVNITNVLFKKQKYVDNLDLMIEICGQKHQGTYKKDYDWNFNAPKIQYTEKSPKEIIMTLKQDDQLILHASSTIKHIKDNKRFVTHSFPLYDIHETKTGILTIDLRFITKQQLLDLMYSPNKLAKGEQNKDKKMNGNASDDNLKKSFAKNSFKHSRVNSSLLGTKTSKKTQNKTMLNRSHIDLQQPEARHPDRYRKVYMINNNNQMIIPKAKRFINYHSSNPNVSYSDPNKLSDFSPTHFRKYGVISHDKQTGDVTKPYKNNPGVGSYRLPSIWDKY